MGLFDRVAVSLTAIVQATGPFAWVVLFGASLVEYVFPPFPGDTIVLLGAWYAVQGAISYPAALIAVTAGAMLGAWFDWRVGWALAESAESHGRPRGRLDAERLARFEAAYRRWGSFLLLANRFLPGIRAFLFLAAGASRIPLRKVIALGGISALLWNGLLLFVGASMARNLDEMKEFFERYTNAAWIAMGLVAAIALAAFLVRRWKAGDR